MYLCNTHQLVSCDNYNINIGYILQMPIIISASSDFDNSVMITGVNEFNNRRHRGATMRMNKEGVELVSNRVTVYFVQY